MNIINIIFLSIFLLIIGGALNATHKNKGIVLDGIDSFESSLKMTNKEYIVFVILFLLAIILRYVLISDIPGGINQDGAMAAVDAKALADYGTDRFGMFMPVHFTAWGYGQMSVLLSYCMIPFIKLFGLSTWSIRMPIFICSIAGLLFLYFIGKKMLGVRYAQILLIFSIFNPWHFMQSRWALDCNMFPHMFLIGTGLLMFGIVNKKMCIYISMIFFALCMYSYGIAFYTVPLFLLVICLVMLRYNTVKMKDVIICVAVYLGLSWPIILTMVINAFKKDTITTPFFTIPFFPNSVRSNDIIFFSDNIGKQLYQNVQSLFRIYYVGDNLPWNTVEGFGAISLCFVPFIFLGVYYCVVLIKSVTNVRIKLLYIIIITWFIIGNLSGLITANVNVNRINILFYSLIILASLGIYYIFKCFKRIAYIIPIAYMIISVLFLNTYFTKQKDILAGLFYEEFVQAVEFSNNTSCTSFIITPDTQYTGARTVSEILTLFVLDIDSKYYQGEFADENQLYYSDKYKYINANECNIDAANPTVYVIRDYEKELFENKGFLLNSFGNYYVAVPETWQ